MTEMREDPAEGAGRLIAALTSGARVTDISLLIDEARPCWWPTCSPYQHKVYNYYADRDGPQPLLPRSGPFLTHLLVIDEHTGTHFDAPPHFIPPPDSGLPHASAAGQWTGDQIPVEQFFGPLDVIDVSELRDAAAPGEGAFIPAELIGDWEATHGKIAPGDVVVFRSGWDEHYRTGAAGLRYVHDVLMTKTAPGWPAPGVEAMRYLHERGVRCVGTDGASMGTPHDGADVHIFGLSHGMVFVEELGNLASLPARGSYFIFLPIKIARSSGGPGRALAFIPDAA